MIHIRTAGFDDIADIKQLLKENDLKAEKIEDYIFNCMIALDNRTPIAAAGFIQNEKLALIQFVVVKKTRQREYIGDGILKALLNLAETKGIREIFIIAQNKSDLFFRKVGFKEVNPNQVNIIAERFHICLKGKNDACLYVALPDFFKNACRAKQYKS